MRNPPPPVAVLVPGLRYTAQAPLLYWCDRMLAEQGWRTETVTWAPATEFGDDPLQFVEDAVSAAFDAAPTGDRRLIVAKSLGTYALPWAQRNGVPGVWLTPVLSSDAIRRALRAATGADMAIGGDADELWIPESVAGTEARLVTVPGADHGLTIPGDWELSVAVQTRLFADISRHVRSLHTPGPR